MPDSHRDNNQRKGAPRLPGETCCGCGACSATCPTGSIEMLPDSLGFLRPSVKADRCVSCGRCESVCPSLHPRAEKDTVLGAFWAKGVDGEELAASSSGGIFGLIARKVLTEGGAVYGAVWTEGWRVEHARIDNASELHHLRKSKYVQSSVGPDVYASVRCDLAAGRQVLYSGTGCQIAALRSYLEGSACDNLLCAEIICHGVPSPKLWQLYVGWLEQRRGERLSGFSFREKEPEWERYSVRADFSDGSSWQVPYMDCWYMAAFMSDLPLRPSCHVCPFKRRSGSDVVLGDFWGIGGLDLGIGIREGVSAVVANTEKGLFAVQGLEDCRRGEVEYGEILAGNRSLELPAPVPERKPAFLKELEEASDLSPFISRWDFVPSRRAVWRGRIKKIKTVASECGTARTVAVFVKIAGKAVVLMAKGADKETLQKMAQVAVEELREKKGGGIRERL